MSKREEIQNQLENYLNNNITKFNAPYGVISGLRAFANGKCRTITFGVERYLDAKIVIYSPDNISINGQGALASKYCGHFTNVNDVINKLKS